MYDSLLMCQIRIPITANSDPRYQVSNCQLTFHAICLCTNARRQLRFVVLIILRDVLCVFVSISVNENGMQPIAYFCVKQTNIETTGDLY